MLEVKCQALRRFSFCSRKVRFSFALECCLKARLTDDQLLKSLDWRNVRILSFWYSITSGQKQTVSLDLLERTFSGSAGSALAALEFHCNMWFYYWLLTSKIRKLRLICDHFCDDTSWHLIGHTVDSKRHSEINMVNQVRNRNVRRRLCRRR